MHAHNTPTRKNNNQPHMVKHGCALSTTLHLHNAVLQQHDYLF